jgi:hypothetical protein
MAVRSSFRDLTALCIGKGFVIIHLAGSRVGPRTGLELMMKSKSRAGNLTRTIKIKASSSSYCLFYFLKLASYRKMPLQQNSGRRERGPKPNCHYYNTWLASAAICIGVFPQATYQAQPLAN